MTCPALPEGFDFTDPDVNQARVPLPEFAALRRSAGYRSSRGRPASTTAATGR
jgi:cholest-4-en-3-one 26-monooxygenase